MDSQNISSNFRSSKKRPKQAILRGDTIFVYFPIAFEITGKELRSTNVEFQQTIDSYIKEFFHKMNITPLVVTPKDRGDRAIFISMKVKEFGAAGVEGAPDEI